jgi:Bacterial regulatory proteins, gntR family
LAGDGFPARLLEIQTISNYRGLEVAEAGMALLNRPLYLQVRDVIIERIGKGEWEPGSALPNEGDLARQFGLSTGTLRKALDHLEAERVLTRRQGCGTYVADQSSDAVVTRYWRIGGSDGKPMAGDVKPIDIVEAPAKEEECRRLRLRPDEHVYRSRSVHLNGNVPYVRGGVIACDLLSRAARREGHPASRRSACAAARRPARQGRGTHLH